MRITARNVVRNPPTGPSLMLPIPSKCEHIPACTFPITTDGIFLATDWGSGKYHIDIWTGSSTVNGGNNQIQCEDNLTPNPQSIVRMPPTNLPVDCKISPSSGVYPHLKKMGSTSTFENFRNQSSNYTSFQPRLSMPTANVKLATRITTQRPRALAEEALARPPPALGPAIVSVRKTSFPPKNENLSWDSIVSAI